MIHISKLPLGDAEVCCNCKHFWPWGSFTGMCDTIEKEDDVLASDTCDNFEPKPEK